MPLTDTDVELSFLDVVAGVPIPVGIPADDVNHVQVYYGVLRATALPITHYTVALAVDYNSFELTPTAALITALSGDTNIIHVRRSMPLITDFDESDAFYRAKIAQEFRQVMMRFQEIYFDTVGEAPAGSVSANVTAGVARPAHVDIDTTFKAALQLVKGDVGLGSADNTSDAAKPVSVATQAALDGKSNTGHTHTKDQVGLANADNTSDADKPISDLQQAALDLKLSILQAAADYQALTAKGQAGGYASLDSAGKIPITQLRLLLVTSVDVVADEAAMLALAVVEGALAIRTDVGKIFALSTNNPGTLADWIEAYDFSSGGDVVGPAAATDGAVARFDGTSGKLLKDGSAIVNAELATAAEGTVKMRRAGTGVGTPVDAALADLKTDMAFVKADVGLGNVDNTSDASKPVSTATQTALDAKVATADKASTAQVRSSATDKYLTGDNVEAAYAAVALTPGATVNLNWDSGPNLTLAPVQNFTLANPTNGQVGKWSDLLVTQDSGADPAGLRTIAYGNQYIFPNGDPPTLATGDGVKTRFAIKCVTTTLFELYKIGEGLAP